MFSHDIRVRVRYAETDQMGYVYYGNYAVYYEVARVEAFRFLGFEYRKLEEQGVMMPVRELNCRYLAPARYDDELNVKVHIKEMPTAKIIFDYEIYNALGDLLNLGQTTLVFVEISSNRIKRCPQGLYALLQPYF